MVRSRGPQRRGSGSQYTYAYNGDGLRSSKTVNSTTESYVWDVAEGMPLLIQDGSVRYITGPGGLPIEQVDGSGTVLYSYQDQLGSTRRLLDGSGNTAATFTYDAYGNLKSSSGSATTPFGYAGQYMDSESGLQYLRARYYDPATEQFLKVDPLESVTGEPYAYTGADPLNLIDPSGMCVLGLPCPGWAQAAGHAVWHAAGQAGNALGLGILTRPQPGMNPPARRVGGVLITAQGWRTVVRHLSRFNAPEDQGGEFGAPYNKAMVERISDKFYSGCAFTPQEVKFYEHELFEARLMDYMQEMGMSTSLADDWQAAHDLAWNRTA